MVATRRSGSLPSNSKKNSSSPPSDDDNNNNKPSSPKRQKVNDNNAESSEKPPVPTENPKELLPETVADGKTADKVDDDVVEVSITPPVSDGAMPVIVEPKNVFSLRKHNNQVAETNVPWCRLLSQYKQNPTILVSATTFLVGSGKYAHLHIKNQAISAILCSIRLSQCEGNLVAVLESRGSKGPVQVNAKTIRRNTSCFLNSGDEVVFGPGGDHAYIFEQLHYELNVNSASDVRTSGRKLHMERRTGDASAVAGASILASLSSPCQDVSHLKPTSQVSGKSYQGDEPPPSPVIHEDELDGIEVDSAANDGSSNAADVGLTSKIPPLDKDLNSGIEAGNMLDERRWTREAIPASTPGMSSRCAVFKEEMLGAILDGQDMKDMEVSFDDFPYYLRQAPKIS